MAHLPFEEGGCAFFISPFAGLSSNEMLVHILHSKAA
jgi:hypothetical protein